MKKYAALVLAVAVPVLWAVHPPAEASGGIRAPLSSVSGGGIFETLACGACVGSGMSLMLSGWGALWAAALTAGNGALAEACVGACAAAL